MLSLIVILGLLGLAVLTVILMMQALHNGVQAREEYDAFCQEQAEEHYRLEEEMEETGGFENSCGADVRVCIGGEWHAIKCGYVYITPIGSAVVALCPECMKH